MPVNLLIPKAAPSLGILSMFTLNLRLALSQARCVRPGGVKFMVRTKMREPNRATAVYVLLCTRMFEVAVERLARTATARFKGKLWQKHVSCSKQGRGGDVDPMWRLVESLPDPLSSVYGDDHKHGRSSPIKSLQQQVYED